MPSNRGWGAGSRNSPIELSANFLIGCDPVSPGCKYCYAAQMAFLLSQRRRKKTAYSSDEFARLIPGQDRGEWTGRIAYLPDRVTKFLADHKRNKPYFVQTCVTSDLFAEGVPFFVIDQIFAVFMLRPRYMFYATTKRASRMAEYAQYAISRPTAYWQGLMLQWEPSTDMLVPEFPLKNLILGPSVEDNRHYYERVASIAKTKLLAATSVIAAEPLIGPIDLLRGSWSEYTQPDWIVASGEHLRRSAQDKPRECRHYYLWNLIEGCRRRGIPLWISQLGNNFIDHDGSPVRFKNLRGANLDEWPPELQIRQMPTNGIIFSEGAAHKRNQRRACKRRRRRT